MTVDGARVHVDDLGTQVVLAGPPQRLVSLVPSLTEILWWWRLADRVVARTTWCTAPPGAFPDAVTVRGTKNPDVAAIVDLAPDLVIVNEEENRQVDVERLREAGIGVWVTCVRTLDDATGSLPRLAAALGVEDAGRELAASLSSVTSSRPRSRPLRAFVPVWRGMPPLDGRDDETWMAVGPATIGADVLAAGGFEVWPAQDPEARYPTVGLEQVLAADLDVALLPDEPYEFTDRDRADLPGLRTRLLDGAGLFWWGPRTPTAVADLRRLARHLRRRARPDRQDRQ